MAKYSTNSSDSSEPDDSCQICGTEEGKLVTAKLEGTILTVCKDCEPDAEHRDDVTHQKTKTDSKVPESSTADYDKYRPENSEPNTNPDWIEEVEYGNTKTPYLVSGYDEILENALEEQNISPEDISEETGVPTESVESLLEHNAMSDEIGRQEIEAVEEIVDIELIDKV